MATRDGRNNNNDWNERGFRKRVIEGEIKERIGRIERIKERGEREV